MRQFKKKKKKLNSRLLFPFSPTYFQFCNDCHEDGLPRDDLRRLTRRLKEQTKTKKQKLGGRREGRGCPMSPTCLESQGCHLIPYTLLSLVFLPSPVTLLFFLFFSLPQAHCPELFPENSSIFFVKRKAFLYGSCLAAKIWSVVCAA